MTEPAEVAAAATALIVCKDELARQLIIESLRPLAIRAEVCEEVFAAARLLLKRKFDGVIVDLLLGEGATLVIGQLRFSRANRTAVTYTITAGGRARGADRDSTFVSARPLSNR